MGRPPLPLPSWPSVSLRLLCSCAVVRVALCGRPVRLTEGDTLYLTWQTGLGPLDGCAATLPDGTETSLPDRATPAADRPRYAGDGYPSGQCGLRADNVTAGVGDWTLKATAADGRLDRHTSRVTCVARQWPRTSTVSVPVGSAVNVTCGPPTAFYCRMTGPSGETSRRAGQCWAYVKSVGSQHLDAWTCWSATTEAAAEVRYTVRLHTYREGASTEIGWNETATEVRVFCNVRRDGPVAAAASDDYDDDDDDNNNGTVLFRSAYCKLTLPQDGQTLSLAYGRGTARYAYHGIGRADCGVSFAKPLRRSETGRWKCANGMSDGRVYGGFVVVVAKTGTPVPPLAVTAAAPLTVSKGGSFQVECGVPSEIDYCWLRHPDGTTIPVTVPGVGRNASTRYRYAGEGLSFGQCNVAVDGACASDTGGWLCALGLRADRVEMYGTVDVTVSESVIAARQDEVYATEGSRVTLGCYTVEKQPIAYCRFLTPRLFGFAVDERSAAPPAHARYAYSGRGLSAGHCGLSVDAVDESDYGNWTCAVRTLDAAGAEEVSTTVVLRKPEGFTMIQIIGIVFCGTLISIVSLFFANHLITNPSARTRKKIEKFELLEAAEMGGGGGGGRRAYGARRAHGGGGGGGSRVVRTPPDRSAATAAATPTPTVPRRI